MPNKEGRISLSDMEAELQGKPINIEPTPTPTPIVKPSVSAPSTGRVSLDDMTKELEAPQVVNAGQITKAPEGLSPTQGFKEVPGEYGTFTENLGRELQAFSGLPGFLISSGIDAFKDSRQFNDEQNKKQEEAIKLYLSGDKKKGDALFNEIQQAYTNRSKEKLEKSKQFVGEAWDMTKESFTHPAKTFYERPISTVLDWLTVLDLASGGLTTGAKMYLKQSIKQIAKEGAKAGAKAGAESVAKKVLTVLEDTDPLIRNIKNPELMTSKEYFNALKNGGIIKSDDIILANTKGRGLKPGQSVAEVMETVPDFVKARHKSLIENSVKRGNTVIKESVLKEYPELFNEYKISKGLQKVDEASKLHVAPGVKILEDVASELPGTRFKAVVREPITKESLKYPERMTATEYADMVDTVAKSPTGELIDPKLVPTEAPISIFTPEAKLLDLSGDNITDLNNIRKALSPEDTEALNIAIKSAREGNTEALKTIEDIARKSGADAVKLYDPATGVASKYKVFNNKVVKEIGELGEYHKGLVSEAIQSGKPIAQKVAEAYPDLVQAKQGALTKIAKRIAEPGEVRIPISDKAEIKVPLSQNVFYRELVQKPLIKNKGLAGNIYRELSGKSPTSLVEKFISDLNAEHIYKRQEIYGRLFNEVAKLSDLDKKILVPFIEGRIALKPEQLSKELKTFIKKYIIVGRDIEKRLDLPVEVLEERALLPVKKALEKEGKLSSYDLPTIQKYYKNMVSQDKAKGLIRISKPLYFPHNFGETVATAKGNMAKAGKFKGERFMERLVNFSKKYTPGFLKKAKGVEGYSEDVKKVLPLHYGRVLSYENSKKAFDYITNYFAEPLKAGEKVKPGYTTWYPEGALKIFKRQIELDEELYKKISQGAKYTDLLETIKKSLAGLEGELTLDSMGVARAKVYQIPNEVAQNLRRLMTPATPFERLLYDPLVSAWKHAVLLLRPAWVVYNAVANETFLAMARVMPVDRVQALEKQFLRQVPSKVKGSTFINEQLFREAPGYAGEFLYKGVPVGKIAVDTKTAIADIWYGNMPKFKEILSSNKSGAQKFIDITKKVWSLGVRPLKKFEDFVIATNNLVERHARASTYIAKSKEFLKQDLKLMGKEGLRLYDNMDDLAKLKYIKNRPELLEKTIDEVNYFLNDYTKKGHLERRYFRRLFPFISFTNHIIRLFFSYPFKYPKTAELINKLNGISKDYQKDIEDEYRGYLSTLNEELPGRLQKSSIRILGYDKQGKAIVFNPAHYSPFDTFIKLGETIEETGKEKRGVIESVANSLEWLNSAGLGLPGAPPIQVFIGESLGVDPFTKRPYERPGVKGGLKLNEYGYPVEVPLGKTVSPGLVESTLRTFPQYTLLFRDILGSGYPTYSAEPYYKNIERLPILISQILGTTYTGDLTVGTPTRLSPLDVMTPPKGKIYPIVRYFGGFPIYDISPDRQKISNYIRLQRNYPALKKEEAKQEVLKKIIERKNLERGAY